MNLIPILLAQIKTRDGIALDGICVLPKKKGHIALIWIHGLTSSFYGGRKRMRELSSLCQKNNVGYFSFNTRGAHIVTRGAKGFFGTAFEKFTDCVLDISAMVRLAKKLGYKKIILAGHSTGANKAILYLYKTRDRSVKGVILVAPLNDIVAETRRIGKKRLRRFLDFAKSRKNKKEILPPQYGLYTAARYLSLHTPESAEDVFPYYRTGTGWKEIRSLRVPLAVFVGSLDKYLDRSPKELLDIFRTHAMRIKSFSGYVVKGASHGFHGKEKKLAQTIIQWIKKLEYD